MPKCYIIDDTTLEKSGFALEHISRVSDHVKGRCVLGYKLLLCAFFDGKTTLPIDFSLHAEKGKSGDYGLTDKLHCAAELIALHERTDIHECRKYKCLCMGMIDFSGIAGKSFLALPQLLPFKYEFNIGAILSVVAVYLVSATKTIGDTSVLCNSALGRNPHKTEMGAAICCDGFVSSVSGLFGCTPITSFSQNVGLAAMSGVVNRFTIGVGAVVMIIGGVFPAVGYVLTTIPQAVLGGCTIMMFGSILFAGFGMMARSGFSQRNMIIVSLSLSVGLGFTQTTGMFNIFPEIVRTVFAENCVAVVFLLAVILNLLLPKKEME